ncbi:putative calcium-binding protein [Heracleum sosnowskyi]|uniref:Calcium-binding protein n=1 Tax=Heracleum sosnowskyi TaxID=360622 RepID=A0AAD8H750_9APIA|nr:putative calcium-binding protein [Heracleum sosnowskyi]
MTQAAVQKHNKVFGEVDTDRDGKITGEQARNLFLSLKLPLDILKQVWDLSDQDNNGMLTLREFCIARYLMERYMERYPLPSVSPSNIIFEDTQFHSSGQPWRHNPGLQQIPGMPGPGPLTSATGGKPSRPVPVPVPVPVPQADEQNMPHSLQKPRLPRLEKHLLDQLSTEEQNSLNSKFKELTEADKKVTELEKGIMDSKEKIEFYHTKMQELILYKSRCDSRLNEIMERVSADKREVETLAKKYEEKYKQSGDAASKLTIEEATFRDIQEKKMELYRAIVKLEREASGEKIKVHADRIQSDLEVQVKTLHERCKNYRLQAKPTTLAELPFGWQPGIQKGTADWDEKWDHFEDEGFTFVKELSLDVKNVIAPPRPKASLVQKVEKSESDDGVPEVSSSVNGKSNNLRDEETNPEHELETTHKEAAVSRSPLNSPSSKNAVDSPSSKNAIEILPQNFQDSPSKKGFKSNSSPNAMETQSENGDAVSVQSERKFEEPAWGSFDTHYDTDAGWDFNLDEAKDSDNEKHSEALFGPRSWGLNPIKPESAHKDDVTQKKSAYTFADSVPISPVSNYGTTPHTDNLFEKNSPFAFADSVPSTPMSSYGISHYSENMFQNDSTFGFADSVPRTPMYNSVNSSGIFGEGTEDHSSDNLCRFDSFNDGGTFASREFSRFDSMSSTRDTNNENGLFAPQESFAKFDSFRSTADSEYNLVFPVNDSLTKFDSMASTSDTDHNRGFPSFDDTDPSGSSGPFNSSVGGETPRRETDSWEAF